MTESGGSNSNQSVTKAVLAIVAVCAAVAIYFALISTGKTPPKYEDISISSGESPGEAPGVGHPAPTSAEVSPPGGATSSTTIPPASGIRSVPDPIEIQKNPGGVPDPVEIKANPGAVPDPVEIKE